ncbi:hypothetical protein Scep_028337 [Stephania cephalantha]|uniref:Protein ELC-like n=1 Tax=Stephania cephalantha TaxID=152367 RepID=A0AAP0EBY5_9MAGN
MASLTASMQFISAALSCDGPRGLSYKHTELKWLIRDDLLSLLRNFPSFTPSVDTFTHDDGETVNLLNASGCLRASVPTPPIPLTIWIHESYPFMPPMVIISPTPNKPIFLDHPFVNPSGMVSSPYLVTWRYPYSNFLDLARNLAHLFAFHHPCLPPVPILPHLVDASIVAKHEALNYITIALHHDMLELVGKAEEDMIGLSCLNEEIHGRAKVFDAAIAREFKRERSRLEKRLRELTHEEDVLRNWLMFNPPKHAVGIVEHDLLDIFEHENKKSRLELEATAEDLAIDDLLYALDNAVSEGVIPFDQYLKQVRNLSREQFFHRAMIHKLRR